MSCSSNAASSALVSMYIVVGDGAILPRRAGAFLAIVAVLVDQCFRRTCGQREFTRRRPVGERVAGVDCRTHHASGHELRVALSVRITCLRLREAQLGDRFPAIGNDNALLDPQTLDVA